MANPRIGGSFAPPLDNEKLTAYEALIPNAPPQVQGAMQALVAMVRAYYNEPRSKANGTPHPSGAGTIVPLEKETQERLFDAIPWMDELNLYGEWFDKLDPLAQKELRNAAFHLLWYGKELCLDREPGTADKL